MRIGIFGGTFNPIHNTHILIALAAKEQLCLDKVLFVVACNPPHKADMDVLDANVRYEIVQKALEKYPFFEASAIEINRQGKSYTYLTLCDLKKIYPQDELFFLVGGDSLSYMDKWYRAKDLMTMCTFVVYPRGIDSGMNLKKECDALRLNYGADCIILNAKTDDVSSTEIRQLSHDGKDISDAVPRVVADYIAEHELYKEE